MGSKIQDSHDTTFRKVDKKSYEFDTLYMGKGLIEGKLYLIINQFNESKITLTKFYSIFLINICPFYDRNSKTCKILFANGEIYQT